MEEEAWYQHFVGYWRVAAAVTLLPAWLAAQEPAVISGSVNGENGRPLASATVSIQQLRIRRDHA